MKQRVAASMVLYEPAGHNEHANGEPEPAVGEYVPAVQFVHCTPPCAYLPAAQIEQL